MNKQQDLERLQACIDALKNMTSQEFLQLHEEKGINLDAPFEEENTEIEDDLEIHFPERKENYLVGEYQNSWINHQSFEMKSNIFASKPKFTNANLLLAA